MDPYQDLQAQVGRGDVKKELLAMVIGVAIAAIVFQVLIGF
jgi:hypothetical protein